MAGASDLLFAAGLMDAFSQRRRAEDVLPESEARFRSPSEMSSDFFWESDIEHRLTQVGRRHSRVPRLSSDEAGWHAHRAVLDAHQPFRALKFLCRDVNGAERHISLDGDPVFDESGAFKGYRGVGTDITGRRRAERRLHELLQAVGQSPAAIVITDADGRIEYANPRFSEDTGYSQDELIGETLAIIKPRFTPPHAYQDLWRTIQSGGVWRGETQNRKKNGELYWVREIISSAQDEHGEIVNLIVSGVPIAR